MVELSEGPVQRGNGKGGPTTPKPVILPKGQASARAALDEQQGDEALVDPEHQGEDRQILHVFYDACMSEGGTADEIHLRGLRAVLSRWGRQPTPPAEGEVAELLAELEVAAVTVESEGGDHEAAAVRRAAELLQRQHPAPVPVSERLPGDQLSWWYEPDEEDGYGGRWTLLRIRGGTGAYTHWLPAHALPQGEVE